jgi:hypothetical protein
VKMPRKEGLYAAVDPLVINKLNDGLLTHMILLYIYTRTITGISALTLNGVVQSGNV